MASFSKAPVPPAPSVSSSDLGRRLVHRHDLENRVEGKTSVVLGLPLLYHHTDTRCMVWIDNG
jgi:hypothetical protein